MKRAVGVLRGLLKSCVIIIFNVTVLMICDSVYTLFDIISRSLL